MRRSLGLESRTILIFFKAFRSPLGGSYDFNYDLTWKFPKITSPFVWKVRDTEEFVEKSFCIGFVCEFTQHFLLNTRNYVKMHSLGGLYYRIEFRLEVIKLHSFSLIFKCLVWLPWVINLTSCFQLLLLHVQIVKKIIANCSIYSDLSQLWFSYVLINLWLKWQLHWFSQHWNKPEAVGDKSAQGHTQEEDTLRYAHFRCQAKQ